MPSKPTRRRQRRAHVHGQPKRPSTSNRYAYRIQTRTAASSFLFTAPTNPWRCWHARAVWATRAIKSASKKFNGGLQ